MLCVIFSTGQENSSLKVDITQDKEETAKDGGDRALYTCLGHGSHFTLSFNYIYFKTLVRKCHSSGTTFV